jgi:hypothetical protein
VRQRKERLERLMRLEKTLKNKLTMSLIMSEIGKNQHFFERIKENQETRETYKNKTRETKKTCETRDTTEKEINNKSENGEDHNFFKKKVNVKKLQYQKAFKN